MRRAPANSPLPTAHSRSHGHPSTEPTSDRPEGVLDERDGARDGTDGLEEHLGKVFNIDAHPFAALNTFLAHYYEQHRRARP